MAGSNLKTQWFNSNIFQLNGKPMRFTLEGYGLCQFHEISKIVEAFGGRVSPPDADTIVFSEPGLFADNDRRRFHIKCLRDSIVQNELQDINKYALPWRIIEHQKVSTNFKIPKEKQIQINNKIEIEISPKVDANPKIDLCLCQPYVLIENCFTKMKSNSLTAPNSNSSKLLKEQSTSVSNSADARSSGAKTADKASPIALKRKSFSAKVSEVDRRKQTPVNVSNDKPKPLRKAVEIIDVEPRKPLINDFIEISDTDDADPVDKKPPEKLKETPPQRKTSEEYVDWKNLMNFVDAPNALAVWSNAGPPGLPDVSDDEDLLRETKSENNLTSPFTTGRAKRINYADLNDSDELENYIRPKRTCTRKASSISLKGSFKEYF